MQMAVMLVVLSVSSSHGNGFDRKDNFISGASGDTSSTGTTHRQIHFKFRHCVFCQRCCLTTTARVG